MKYLGFVVGVLLATSLDGCIGSPMENIYLRTCTLHRRRLVVLITTVAFKAEFSVPLQLLHPCPDGCDLKFFDGSAVLRPQTTKSILALFLY